MARRNLGSTAIAISTVAALFAFTSAAMAQTGSDAAGSDNYEQYTTVVYASFVAPGWTRSELMGNCYIYKAKKGATVNFSYAGQGAGKPTKESYVASADGPTVTACGSTLSLDKGFVHAEENPE